MFRRAATTFARAAAGLGAVQLGAAGVALSDKELGKKPEWYKNSVLELQASLEKLSKKGYIESPSQLEETGAVLKKYADEESSEIQWRIARYYAEKAEFTKCPKEKAHLLHEAKNHAKKALAHEPATGVAGAHKWYAIILRKLDSVDKKVDHTEEVVKHLEKAVSLDAKDPYALQLLGEIQLHKKDYKGALATLEKAEKIKANFSTANHTLLGEALKGSGKKDDAIKAYKQALEVAPKYSHDGKAVSQAKAALNGLGLKPEEYEVRDL